MNTIKQTIQSVSRINIVKRVAHTVWLPFLWVVIQDSKGLMFWKDLFSGQDPASVDTAQLMSEGSSLDRLVLSILLVIATVVLMKRLDKVIAFIKENYPLVGLIVFLGLTILWSDLPLISLKRWIRCGGTVAMVVLIFTDERPLQSAYKTIHWISIFFMVGSLITISIFPNVGIDIWPTGEATWVGLTPHKNTLGEFAALAVIFYFWLLLYKKNARVKKRYWLMLVVSIIILIGAKSFTSIFVAAAGLLTMVLIGLAGKIGKFGFVTVFLLVVSLCVATAVFQNGFLHKPVLAYLLEEADKDLTFTGRTEVWNLAFKDAGAKNLLVGNGYAAFWNTAKADRIRSILGWDCYSAHSGYLDLLLQTGIIGFGLFLLFLLGAFVNVIKMCKTYPHVGSLGGAFFIVAVISNYSESNLVYSANIYWFIVLIISVNIKGIMRADSLYQTNPATDGETDEQ